MIRHVTTFLFLLAGLSIVGNAFAQDPMQVTVRDLNAISQENVDALNAGGAALTEGDIQPLVLNDLQGVSVQFVAVVLSDPLSSGLGTPQEEEGGNPDRIHVYVRDTAAVRLGPMGMGIQLVDGAYDATGLINVTVGNIIRVTGSAAMFTGSGGNSQQVEPSTIEVLGDYDDVNFDLPESILDPVLITSAEANAKIDEEGGVQVNWNNLASLNGQYVRLEGATIAARDVSSERPNWLISSDGGETVLNFYDVSLRYRNDRDGAYPATFNVREDDFEPPPPGATVNIQGFLVYQGDDPFSRGVPDGAILSIAPFQDGDLEVTASPPIITEITGPDFVPDGSAPVDITAIVTADPSRTITSAVLKYTTSDSEEEQEATGSETDGVYTFSVPAQADGVFVTYAVEATDSEGAVSLSDQASYRTLADGIDEIADIQFTLEGGPGNSPFNGITTAMSITATVQTSPGASGILAVQDDETLAPWTGIFINPSGLPELNAGDVISITEATIQRRDQFGFPNETWLIDVTMDVTSTGGDILGYKEVDTNTMQDPGIAKAHEGMLLRFNNVQITNNDAGFGMWEFATIEGDTTQAPVLADDVSSLVDGGSDMFTGFEKLEFTQGVWLFAFGSYRVLPEDPATDIGPITNVANEEGELPNSFSLEQNFPNPFNPTTSIGYTIARTGPITLHVYDILGRRVATLIDQVVNAGEHTITFDAQDLPSGMYLYRLTAGSDVSTKKMLLLK